MEEKNNLKGIILFVIVLLGIVILNSFILLFWIGWFFILWAAILLGGILAAPLNLIPVAGNALSAFFVSINKLTTSYKIELYIGFGITLFLHLGLRINIVRLVTELLL